MFDDWKPITCTLCGALVMLHTSMPAITKCGGNHNSSDHCKIIEHIHPERDLNALATTTIPYKLT